MRALALLLALAVALSSFMHVAHGHDADGPTSKPFCSFCSTFERGAAPPPVVAAALPTASPLLPPDAPRPPLPAAPVHPSSQPRAPPHLQA